VIWLSTDYIKTFSWRNGSEQFAILPDLEKINVLSEVHSDIQISRRKKQLHLMLGKETMFPPSISVCNASALSFDKSKMVLDNVSSEYIPTNGTKYAYAPWITKSGSSSMVHALKYASENDGPSLNVEQNSMEEIIARYDFLSVLRHPMERALAGFHQVEIFWLMNWIDIPIDKFGLSWFNKTCLNSTWGSEKKKAERKYQCKGDEPKTTTQRRLRRLNDFLDEIEKKGFWDQHITPMSYIIASNKFHHHARYFDIQHIDNLTDIIATSAGKPKETFGLMKRGNYRGADWIVKWKELVTLSTDYELARLAVGKLCRLYRNDITCLPYNVPECDHMLKNAS